ncbi:hypothetical protein HYH02_007294 [Chlamydomonas schloesseri]|uniref:Uncharacterized protein n=1 Tax=Chlamydomonas schloesseri TaxID=2026947 RepID=A0A835WHV9_9CHLO|nr:hypothetical protein HYH02_007294 [Chlamydomonas schloesseri]|eukprot:KAG2447838.1 hypothetical protein HYH02_007294 [Chlamydomonas schloesseri]
MESGEQLPVSRSARSRKHGALCARRPAGFWHKFNEWWREFKEAAGTRPKIADIERFYSSTEGQAAWSSDERPCIKDVVMHCKGMRTRTEVRDYFREYRRRRSGTRSSAGSESSAATSSEDHTRSTCTTHAAGHDSDDAMSPAPSRCKRRRRQAPTATAAGAGGGRPPLPPPVTGAAAAAPPALCRSSQQRLTAAVQPGGSGPGSDRDTCSGAPPVIQVHYEMARQRGTLHVAGTEMASVALVHSVSSAAGDSAAAADNSEHYGLLLQPSSDALRIAPLQLHDSLTAGALAAHMLHSGFETGHGSTMVGAGGICNTNGTAVGSLPQMLLLADDEDGEESAGTQQRRQEQAPPHFPRGHNAAGALGESCDEHSGRSTDGDTNEAASQSTGTQQTLQQSQQGEVAPHAHAPHNRGPQHSVLLGAASQWGTEAPPLAAGAPSWLLGAHLLPAPPLPPLSVALSEPGHGLGWPRVLQQPWDRASDVDCRHGHGGQHAPQDGQRVQGAFTSAPPRLGLPLLAAFPPPATRSSAPVPKAHVASSRGGASAVPSCAWAASSAANGPGVSSAATGLHSLRMMPALAPPGHAHHAAAAAWYPPAAYGFYTPADGFSSTPYGWYPQAAPSAYGRFYQPRLYPVFGQHNNSTNFPADAAGDAAVGTGAAGGAPPPGRMSESGSEAGGGNDDVPAAPAHGVRTLRTTNNRRQVPGSGAAPTAEAAAALKATAADLRWSPTSPNTGLTTNSVFCWAKASATIAAGDTSEDPAATVAAAPSMAPAAARALGGSLAAADGQAAPAAPPAGDKGSAPASLKRTRTPADAASSPISALIQARTAASGGRSMASSGGAAACGTLLPATDDLGDLLNEAFDGGLWETPHEASAFDPLMSLSGGLQ